MKLTTYSFSVTFTLFLITTIILNMNFVPSSMTGVAAQRRGYFRNYGYTVRAQYGGNGNGNRRRYRVNRYPRVWYRTNRYRG